MYGSADRLPVIECDVAIDGLELGTGTLELADQCLLLALKLVELGLDEMDSVSELLCVSHESSNDGFVKGYAIANDADAANGSGLEGATAAMAALSLAAPLDSHWQHLWILTGSTFGFSLAAPLDSHWPPDALR
jgi:hypothetical protein